MTIRFHLENNTAEVMRWLVKLQDLRGFLSRSCDISLTFSWPIVVSEVLAAIYRRPSSDNDTTRGSNPATNKGINKFLSAQAYGLLLLFNTCSIAVAQKICGFYHLYGKKEAAPDADFLS